MISVDTFEWVLNYDDIPMVDYLFTSPQFRHTVGYIHLVPLRKKNVLAMYRTKEALVRHICLTCSNLNLFSDSHLKNSTIILIFHC